MDYKKTAVQTSVVCLLPTALVKPGSPKWGQCTFSWIQVV